LLKRQPSGRRPRLDLPGTVAVCAAMFCLVYGFSNADAHSWGTPSTWGFLAAVAAGLAYLPMLIISLAASITANIAALPRTGPRPLVAAGLLLAAGGMVWLTRIGLHSGYAAALLGPLLICGTGVGLVVSPSMNTATFGVPPADAGVASATANTQQQIGTSIGTALLNTIAVSATTSYLTARLAGNRPTAGLTALAALHGYTTAFWWAAGILAAGAIVCGTLLRRGVLAGQGDSGHAGTPAPQPEVSQLATADQDH